MSFSLSSLSLKKGRKGRKRRQRRRRRNVTAENVSFNKFTCARGCYGQKWPRRESKEVDLGWSWFHGSLHSNNYGLSSSHRSGQTSQDESQTLSAEAASMRRLPSPGKNKMSCSLQRLHSTTGRHACRGEKTAGRRGAGSRFQQRTLWVSCRVLEGEDIPKSAGTQLLTDNRGRVRGKDEQVSNSNPQAVAEISWNHTQQPSLCKFFKKNYLKTFRGFSAS